MKTEDPVVAWLLAGDPSIRWQILPNAAESARERVRVARAGWGRQLLAVQGADGIWGGGLYTPKWISTTYTLLLLKLLGLAGGNRKAARAVEILLDAGLYRDGGINL